MKFKVLERTVDSTQHAFDFIIEDKKNHTLFSLYRSHSTMWTESCRGELCMSIKDNGNKIKIINRKNKLDYHEARELHVILQCLHFYEDNYLTYPSLDYEIIPENN